MQLHWEHRLRALAGDSPRPAGPPVSSYWRDDPRLGEAYELCATVTARHSKSFHLASALLPASKRHAVRALYAFCRTVDDIVDAPAGGAREALLEEWRGISQGGRAPDGNLIAAAWTDAMRRYHIPRRFALQLIDGVARDLAAERYATFNDLSTYCYGVASTVGLMAMYIVGFNSGEAVPYAIKLGVALQMTNILRDVGEDYRNGRVYLPESELRQYGVGVEDLEAGSVTGRWRDFMRFQIDRTRRLYAEALPGVRLLDPDGQMAIAAAAELYRRILDVIERNDYDVFTRRASVSAWEKIARLPPLFIKVRFGLGSPGGRNVALSRG
jgi:phytoene synthase